MCVQTEKSLSSTNKANIGDNKETGQPLESLEAQLIVPGVPTDDSQ